MGEDQWFHPIIRNRLPLTIILARFTILYGKFYDIHHPYNETQSAQGTKIKGRNQYQWGHCGRQNSPSGTEGYFEVHLEAKNEKIAEIYWDCPYIGSNRLEVRYVKPGYDIEIGPFSRPGPLGRVTISVRVD